jgi:Holliday junction resolvase-like predicted endonuclease
MTDNITITKRSGEKVLFDTNKLRASFERSGAGTDYIEEVIAEVKQKMTEGISTQKLYQLAYSILRKKSNHAAGRYRLKKAIFDLGPTGYPFEKFVGELLKNQGYKVEVGVIINGNCVQHEIDVLAEKDNRKYMIECKFHTDPHRKSDVKVALYIHSRFLDVEKEWLKNPDGINQIHQGWIVTNTRFTEDAVKFGKCAGLNMISWDYPASGSLRQRIDQSGLHPITALQNLTKKEKQEILNGNIVLSRDLTEDFLLSLGIPKRRISKIMKEVMDLVNGVP